MPWVALTREVGESIARCELTHLAREPIDLGRARTQHAAYETVLRDLSCRVERVPPAPDCPDAVFIEDTAVVLPELAIVTRPGAPSRRPEVGAVAETLRAYRETVTIDPPGTVDGGDVLVAGRAVFVGQTTRTNAPGLAQMKSLLSPFGYRVVGVPVRDCLHLKSAATEVADDTLLVQPQWVEASGFGGFEIVEVDPRETHGANALRIGDQVVYPAAFPRTAERLEARGIQVLQMDMSELAKAEGAVTCCSLVFADGLA
jgi:dimethylargininase